VLPVGAIMLSLSAMFFTSSAAALSFRSMPARAALLTRSSATMSVASAESIAVDDASEALKFVTLTNAAGDTAKVYTFGACVTSYIKDGTDALMVRPDALMDGSKPISGGIPFCFPQFGPGAMQQHGFARNLEWEIAEKVDGDAPAVVFKLVDSEYTRAMWDYPFELKYTVSLGPDALDTSFKVMNLGESPFDFTGALHSYWSISSVSNIKVTGPFQGVSYLDKVAGEKVVSEAAAVDISKETDSVYEGVGGEVVLEDSGKKSALSIKSSGWADTVVWNPYGDEKMGYDSFVCVECAKALAPITVAAKETWEGTMTITPGSL